MGGGIQFFLEIDDDEETVIDKNKQFEDLLLNINDRKQLEHLVRLAGYSLLGLALRDSSNKLRRHLFKNLSKTYRTELNDEIIRIGPCRLQECIDAKKRIVSFF